MNAARIKQRIATLRTDLDELERALDEETGPSGAPSPWMRVPAYAEYAGVSSDTVRRWIVQGMREAGAVTGQGKLVRIHRDKADEWRRSR